MRVLMLARVCIRRSTGGPVSGPHSRSRRPGRWQSGWTSLARKWYSACFTVAPTLRSVVCVFRLLSAETGPILHAAHSILMHMILQEQPQYNLFERTKVESDYVPLVSSQHICCTSGHDSHAGLR